MTKRERTRSIAIARLIRSLIWQRDAEVKALESVVPNVRRKLRRWELGETEPNLSTFLDLMTMMRLEVILVPKEWMGGQWVVLNRLPYNDGSELRFPEEVKKRGPLGRRKRHE